MRCFQRKVLVCSLAVVVGALVCAANPASAQDNPPVKAKVTVFLMPDGEVGSEEIARLSHALVKALRENPNLKVKDPGKLLVEFAGQVPDAEIEQAEQDLEKGFELLKKKETIFALEQFKNAVASMEKLLAFIKKSTLARGYQAFAVTQAQAGNRKAAYQSFVKLLTWRSNFPFDTKMFGARYLPLYAKAQQTVAKLPRGSVELTSEPEGANAYVDGRFVGITPTVAYGLAVGEHFATFKKEGYIKAARKITVNPNEQRKFSKKLPQSEKSLLLKQSLARIRTEVGQAKASDAMTDLRAFLFIDQAVFALVKAVGDGSMQVTAHLYDLRSKVRLNHGSRTVHLDRPSEIKALTGELFAGVRYDGLLELPPEPPPPPPTKRTPIYAKWWFWTAVGVVVAGVVVPTVMLTQSSSACPDGYRCLTVTN